MSRDQIVTIDGASLCIKSGVTLTLRGGSDSFNSSKYLTELIQEGLNMANLPKDECSIDPIKLIENL